MLTQEQSDKLLRMIENYAAAKSTGNQDLLAMTAPALQQYVLSLTERPPAQADLVP